MFIFPVQQTTSRIGNLTRLIHTLLYVMTIHTYIHTYILCFPPIRYRLFMLFYCTTNSNNKRSPTTSTGNSAQVRKCCSVSEHPSRVIFTHSRSWLRTIETMMRPTRRRSSLLVGSSNESSQKSTEMRGLIMTYLPRTRKWLHSIGPREISFTFLPSTRC